MIDVLKKKYDSSASKDRRYYTRNLYNMFQGSWRDSRDSSKNFLHNQNEPNRSILTNELAKRFPKTWKELNLTPDTSINILRWASDQIGNIYDVPTERTIEGEEIPSYSNTRLQQTLAKVAPLTSAVRNTFLRPIVTENDGLQWDVIRGDQAEVIADPDNPFRIKQIVYEVGKKKVVWTDSFHATYSSWDIKNPDRDPLNPNFENPYEFVPFVPIHAEFPIGEFWDIYGSNELYTASLETAVAMTNFRRFQMVASHKQPWLKIQSNKGDDVDRFAILDPAYPLVLKGAGTDVGTVDLQADLDAMLGSILNIVTSILVFLGFSPDSVRGNIGSASSGYAIKLQNAALEAVRDKQRTNWRGNEERMLDVARRVIEVEKKRQNLKEVESIPEGEFKISFGDTNPEASPTEQKDYWQDRLEKGTATLVDTLIKLDGLSKEEAILKAIEIESSRSQRLAAQTFAVPIVKEDL